MENTQGKPSIRERNEILSFQREIDRLNLRLGMLPKSFSTSGMNSQDDPSSFLQVTITRFGTVGMVIFAVTLFMGLYRYYMRLAVFYEARADVLRLFVIDGISTHYQLFQILSDSMTPPVDFGKIPSTPATKLAEKVGIPFKRK